MSHCKTYPPINQKRYTSLEMYTRFFTRASSLRGMPDNPASSASLASLKQIFFRTHRKLARIDVFTSLINRNFAIFTLREVKLYYQVGARGAVVHEVSNKNRSIIFKILTATRLTQVIHSEPSAYSTSRRSPTAPIFSAFRILWFLDSKSVTPDLSPNSAVHPVHADQNRQGHQIGSFKSAKNSDPGATPVTSRRSRARVQAT